MLLQLQNPSQAGLALILQVVPLGLHESQTQADLGLVQRQGVAPASFHDVAVGIGFGPRFLASQDGLRATGLWQPGALVRWTYRVVMDESADAARLGQPGAT